ncbi:MAG: nitrite/sulfite reductase [Geminicoccaceae bacterium]
MYRYDEFDRQFVLQRTAQFADQVKRRLSGELSEDEFKPLRLKNGLYLQLDAYMLRIAIPYGTLSSRQLTKLADIVDRYDLRQGHFTPRQDLQLNWPELNDAPPILGELAEVELHAIQTSDSRIRNVTTDQYAGVAADEVADPRPWAELLRQWSTLHPEFSCLPRRLEIAISAATANRAAVRARDVGLILKRDEAGTLGFEILVGGGPSRTPRMGKTLREFLPADELLAYSTAIMRVYNRFGRRDNKYRARVNILVRELGLDAFRREVEAEYAAGDHAEGIAIAADELERIRAYFAAPSYESLADRDLLHEQRAANVPEFGRWVRHNTAAHKVSGYVIVNVSLKPIGGIPGDMTSEQMRTVATLANEFSHGEIRATHEQNLVLPYVRTSDLFAVWNLLDEAGLGTPTAAWSPTSSPAPAWVAARSRRHAQFPLPRRSAGARTVAT